jgi:hypothetical protein
LQVWCLERGGHWLVFDRSWRKCHQCTYVGSATALCGQDENLLYERKNSGVQQCSWVDRKTPLLNYPNSEGSAQVIIMPKWNL